MMDAITGGKCAHASFEAIEDAAAYAFGDGNNDSGDAINASANATATTAVVVEEVDEPLTKEFTDNIWFLVLQLCFGVNIHKFMTNPGQKFRTKNVHCLIPNFGLVSKSCLGCCHRFIRQVPLMLYTPREDYYTSTLFLCRNNVKLGTILNFPDNSYQLSQWLHMLRSVDTSELKTMKVTPSSVSLREITGLVPLFEGVDEDDRTIIMEQESPIEDSIVKTLREVNPPLEDLTLDIKNRRFYEPILEMVSQTLTHLTLYIRDMRIEEDERLGQLIERLPYLEELTIQVDENDEGKDCEISIKSRSLKELSIHSSIHVRTVVCPSLKKLKIRSWSSTMAIRTLTQVANTLEELDLAISEVVEELDLEIYGSKITTAIENMPKLKKLVMCGPNGSEFVIKSISLEQIDALGYWSGIEKCICPSLKLFQYRHSALSLVRPVSPLCGNDIPPKGHTKEFKVGERPFVGMNAPDSCIVEVFG